MFEEVAGLHLDLVVPLLGVVDCLLVHPVVSNNHPMDTKRVRQKNVLASLAVLRDIDLKLARRRRNNKDSIIRLRSPRDHLLDEVAVARRVDDREVALARLRLQRDVCRDTTLTLSLRVVSDPRVLERALAQLP